MTISTLLHQKWILASASPRRREILAALGLRFRIEPSRIPEPECAEGNEPSVCAMRLARAKAVAVGSRHKSGVVIGADTVVYSGKVTLGKPADDQDARAMLRRLSGRWHDVITGLCLYDCGTRRCVAGHSRSRVHFRRITAEDIDWYLSTGEHRDKAGAYAIQGRASLFIDRIEGCYFNIVGFPVATFHTLCRRLF
jgi:septum formation protein